MALPRRFELGPRLGRARLKKDAKHRQIAATMQLTERSSDLHKWALNSRAGEGNRTPVTSLGSWSSTIELHPHEQDYRWCRAAVPSPGPLTRGLVSAFRLLPYPPTRELR